MSLLWAQYNLLAYAPQLWSALNPAESPSRPTTRGLFHASVSCRETLGDSLPVCLSYHLVTGALHDQPLSLN